MDRCKSSYIVKSKAGLGLLKMIEGEMTDEHQNELLKEVF